MKRQDHDGKAKKSRQAAEDAAQDKMEEVAVEQTPEEAAENPEQRLKDALVQRDEYLSMAQRVQADFDNFRRRNASVRSESFEDGAASFIKTILPVCDNLERALDAGSEDEALLGGVRLVQKQLLEALEKRGVQVIDRVGEPFDPKWEDAVVQGTPDEGEPGTVAQVMLKGYRMGDTVLRHAMVKVIVA